MGLITIIYIYKGALNQCCILKGWKTSQLDTIKDK